MKYWVKTPKWMKIIFPKGLVWKIPPAEEAAVYLTFDDGPHPTATEFIMQQLEQHDAKATFFCLGKNVLLYPDVYQKLVDNGHRLANHTQNHLNGWKTKDADYLDNIKTAANYIDSNLFRPPYGMIRRSQARQIKRSFPGWKICMWDVLSGDFDTELTPQRCLDNVLKAIEPGSIVLFHDSDKAWPRMSYVLPRVLAHCQQQRWKLKALP